MTIPSTASHHHADVAKVLRNSALTRPRISRADHVLRPGASVVVDISWHPLEHLGALAEDHDPVHEPGALGEPMTGYQHGPPRRRERAQQAPQPGQPLG